MRDGRALFSGGLRNLFALADLKMNRLLDTFDELGARRSARADAMRDARCTRRGRSGCRGRLRRSSRALRAHARARQAATRSRPARRRDQTVIWATGFRPDYRWLHVPVLDAKGHLRHDGGIVDSPGLYAIGLPLLRRRKSTFIHGAEDDARDLTDHLAQYLAKSRPD